MEEIEMHSSRASSETQVEDGLLEKDQGFDHQQDEFNEQSRTLLNPSFLSHRRSFKSEKKRCFPVHIFTLYLINVLLAASSVLFFVQLRTENRLLQAEERKGGSSKDQSLGIWSPGNDAVEYYERHFTAALFNQTEYMGFPTDKTDKLWSDLYNFGISKISEEEAKMLPSPTLPIPGTNEYLIQFDVWHELHCLNDLRKIIYPERFPDMCLVRITVDGVVNRDNAMFRHWDHCIDSLRQTLMCHSDVSPIPFHVNLPKASGVFPRLATTHTCRNFSKIQQWAVDHNAGEFKFLLEPDEAAEIVANAGFDQGPEEDIEFLYNSFPGNKFFKHWREHDVCDEGEVCPM